ncbi:hypothetical protein ACIPSA_09245 [Streptomyces sp. NPDC086549]|uniref:hypothetical protein n=1 Tax=Streptomyces sp. NPDC086549 TaxID=3365752 RepID=UPI0037F8DD81
MPFPRRGRHRRPRPRKVLLAAGGLALAAGVLSLLRMSPESGVGSPGTAEAEPRLDPGGGTDHRSATNTAGVASAPTGLPSATSVMGGVSAAPAWPTASPLPTDIPTAIPTAAPRTTHGPSGTGTTPVPTTTTSAGPRPDPTRTQAPAPAPSHSRIAPAPRPSRGGGLCVPVIGLCVDPLRAPRGHGLLP